jgi:quaternary ammonium compound-resistance protein SugE
MFFLSLAERSIPIGTAYAVWVGIGILGAAVLGIVLLQDPVTPARLVFLTLLLVSMIALKLSGPGN